MTALDSPGASEAMRESGVTTVVVEEKKARELSTIESCGKILGRVVLLPDCIVEENWVGVKENFGKVGDARESSGKSGIVWET